MHSENPYNASYYEAYEDNIPYRDQRYKDLFNSIAESIVQTLNPRTVLDVGCAFGYLVYALRKRGVEAYGIDISEYAISQADSSIREYCHVGTVPCDLPSGFPERFDLVTTIEVAEHIYEEDASELIAGLCKYSDRLLFSSTSKDIEDITHVNVQQPEYWAKKFAMLGFFKELQFRADFISADAFLFTRRNLPNYRIVEEYERVLRIIKSERTPLEGEITELRNKAASYESYILKQEEEKKHLKKWNSEISDKLKAAQSEADCAMQLYTAISSSRSWRITKPVRAFLGKIKAIINIPRNFLYVKKGLRYLKQHGFSATISRIFEKNSQTHINRLYYHNHIRSQAQLIEERAAVFGKDITFSILVPLYNTPKKFLLEMIQSVQKQTYAKWELCLADGSTSQYEYVRKLCEELSKSDPRIRYRKLDRNLGISENTNACIEMAQGEYCCLFDHDDVLHPSALFEVMKVICQKDADFIYTDEATFINKLDAIQTLHFKPDYALDNLRANNYICHLTTFKKELLKKSGLFRKEFDGSQDHDFILRITRAAEKIEHIPQVLYYWRSHRGSVASDINAKVYAIEAGKKAAKESILAAGENALVESTRAFPTIFRFRYELKETPLISIIIPTKNNQSMLQGCIDSIIAKTSYDNYEILILDNGSDSVSLNLYYKQISQNPHIRVIAWPHPFNYSAVNNYGAAHANGKYLVLLNDDTQVITEDWLQELLMYAQRSDVGAVGAKLYYKNKQIQHAGIILQLGVDRIAGHVFAGCPGDAIGYMGRLHYAQNVSAVTAACLMVDKEKYKAVGGLDELFSIAYNDVDFCLRLRGQGLMNIFTPFAELYHFASQSRGSDESGKNRLRLEREACKMKERWSEVIQKGDPYYNPNLSLDSPNFDIIALKRG